MSPSTARLVGRFASVVVRIWRALYRSRPTGYERVEQLRAEGKQFAFSLWHGTLFAPILHHAGIGAVTMASRSTDGEIITAMLGPLGYVVARGSTGRGKGGGQALEEMVEIMRNDRRDGALTVDGPRGPAHVVQPGVVRLARATGAWILPLGCASRRQRHLRSWDRFALPNLFDVVEVVHGEPFPVDESWSEEEACRRIAEAISSANREARKRAGLGEATEPGGGGRF
jgi:lysophospholipid acyltransferase (LPLAT)-like uncharacterized protein